MIGKIFSSRIGGGVRFSPREPKSLWACYREILSPLWLASMVTVGLVAVAGLFEGMAILTLIPILQFLREGSNSGLQGRFVDVMSSMFGADTSDLLLGAVGIFVVLGIVAGAFRLASDAAVVWIRSAVEQYLRAQMTGATLNMSWAHFSTLQTGDLSKAVVEEGFRVGIGCYSFLSGLGAALIVVVFLSLSFLVSVELTSYTLAFGALGVAIYLPLNHRAKRYSKELSGLQGAIGTQASEVFGSLKFYRASGRSDIARDWSLRAFAKYSNAFFWSQAYPIVVRFFFESGAVIFVASFLIINQFLFRKDIESLLVFLTLFYRLSPRLLRAQEELMRARTYLPWYKTWRDRMQHLLRFPDSPPQGEVPSFKSELRLDNVTFGYPSSSGVALDSLSLAIRQGESVAIVGASGGGKTTLLDVILGLLDPAKGKITLDGRDLRGLNVKTWRERIGLVTQENPLFFGSVIDNIAWGEETPNRAAVEQAARKAHAWDFIKDLPDGLDTHVGERGGRLSGGQRQRIAIARALYRDPLLLILDEATSALDSEAERIIQDSLAELKGTRAMLLVAHRLNTIRFADRIVVLDKGRLVEQGGWDELCALPNGVFRRLAFAQQAA